MYGARRRKSVWQYTDVVVPYACLGCAFHVHGLFGPDTRISVHCFQGRIRAWQYTDLVLRCTYFRAVLSTIAAPAESKGGKRASSRVEGNNPDNVALDSDNVTPQLDNVTLWLIMCVIVADLRDNVGHAG